MKTFRISGTDFFLTYSQCPLDKTAVYDNIMNICSKTITYLMVSTEQHKDGGIHHHCQFQLSSKYNLTSQSRFDITVYNAGPILYHPNIQRTEDSENVRAYVSKHDPDPLVYGVFTVYYKLKGKPKLTNEELLTIPLKTLVDTNRISVYNLPGLSNARRIYQNLCTSSNPDVPDTEFPSLWKDVTIPVIAKTVKKRHYWIYSSMPDKGKTTYLNKLKNSFRTYKYGMGEKFQNMGIGVQIVYFDEYAPGNCLKVTELNEICDGDFKFIRKGLDPIILDSPYIFLCSNYSIREVYPNKYATVEARFNEICLDNIDFI